MPTTQSIGTASSGLEATDRDRQPTFRPDIEGLRAVAVLLVVLYHSSVPGFSGGYVGVDVFFVISGYLIAGTLLREVGATSTVRLSRFWARRIRRLVPALSVMIVVTWIAGIAIESPLGWEGLAREGASAATYTSNILFAREQGGYFANAESPFLHTWSLSVEEQFYVGWPILVLVAVKLFRSRSTRTRRDLGVLFAVVAVVSFVMCLWATERGTPWAYYSAPTRAWEFGLGALLALVGGRVARLGHRTLGLAVVAGLATILFAATQFDSLTKFPGPFALVPVVGTVLVLAGGSRDRVGLPAKLLGTSVFQALGRLSYSWYLWHWPFLVLAARWVGPLSVPASVGVSILALGMAAVSYAVVERPLRYARWLQAPFRSIGLGALSVFVLVTGGVGVALAADRALQDPYLASLVGAREGRTDSGPSGACSIAVLGGAEYCVYGPDDAARLVLLVGDSHAAQWSPAVIEGAAANEARLLIRTYGGCPAIEVPVRATGESGVSEACQEFRQGTQRLIEALDPDLVVMSNADYTNRLLDRSGDGLLSRQDAVRLWADQVSAYAEALRAREVPLAVIANNPSMSQDPIECLARHPRSERCAEDAGPLLAELGVVSRPEREALERAGVAGILDVAPLICVDDRCRAESETGPIFSDSNHLSAGFVLSATPLVSELLASGLK